MTRRFAAALSAHPSTEVAIGEAIGTVLEQVGTSPDLAVVTFTEHHTPFARELAETLCALVEPSALVGASAGGVLGVGQGRESEPGLALWTAHLDGPAERLRSFALRMVPTEGGATVMGLDDDDMATADAMVLFADPWTFPTVPLLNHLAHRHPHLKVIGGLASAADVAGGNRLITNAGARADGAVGVLLPPGVLTGTVVSQGCRPIGQPWTVTASHGNVIEQLGGRPALERLRDLFTTVSPTERTLALSGLHCGVLADDRALDPDRGDFLVRAVLAVDDQRATVTVGAEVPVGTVVQFHVRDATTAGEDLAFRLAKALRHSDDHGALVFTCNGRGRAMFDTPHHDAQVVQQVVGPHAVGMMCAGEIGPVAGRTHLHGFTASVALF